MKKSKTKGVVVILLLIVAIVGLVSGVFYFTSQSNIQPTDRVFGKVYGYLKCEYTGLSTGWSNGVEFLPEPTSKCALVDNKYSIYYHWVECPSYAGDKGCDLKFDYVECAEYGYQPMVRFGNSGLWQIYTDNLIKNVKAGDNALVQFGCGKGFMGNPPSQPDCGAVFGATMKYKPLYLWRFYSQAIYKYTEGFAPQGKLSGSEPRCSLMSGEAEEFKKTQVASEDSIAGLQNLQLGETKSIIVGWREDPAFGNVNPLGQYGGNDVACKFNDALYKLNKVTTVGGVSYYTQGSSLGDLNGVLCCGADQCPTGKVCEAYKCVAKPVNCAEGQCNSWEKGTCPEKDKPLEENGKYFLQTVCCDSSELACRKTTKTEVKCTPASCDKLDKSDEDWACDYQNGCYKVQGIKKPCPTGECCLEQNSEFNKQDCGNGQFCCNALVNNDPYRGLCMSGKTETEACGNKVAETGALCYDGVDNDVDGLIDDQDPDCFHCLVDGKDMLLDQRECCEAQEGTWVEEKTLGGVMEKQYCLKCSIWNKLTQKECGGGDMKLFICIMGTLLSGLAVFLILRSSARFGEDKSKVVVIAIAVISGLTIGAILYYFWAWIIGISIGLVVGLVILKLLLKK
jgi:hypothetical protein